MQREGLRKGDGSELYLETKHNCTGKRAMGSLARAGSEARSEGGRPPVGRRFRQPDRTPFFRLTPAFGLPSLRKNGYVQITALRGIISRWPTGP